ncbi:NrfD/PsrC family molybdoenzyme membrane anchor subunit [Chloroflexota bacterium]
MTAENNNPVLNSRFLKPQDVWGWQVAVYLYLAGMGAGALAVGLLMDWLGLSPYSPRSILVWGSILVAFGALFLVLKLGKQLRFLNTILNPQTSWLSRGFYILSVCIIVGVIILGISLLPFFGIDISGWTPVIIILDILGFIFAMGTAIYTGILIMSVKYVSFWNTWLLPGLFTVSALSTGLMAIILVTFGYDLIFFKEGYSAEMMHLLLRVEQYLLVIEVIVFVLYLYRRYHAEGQGKASVRLLLFGNLKYVFWLGIVVAGFILPVILETIYSGFHGSSILLVIAGVFTLLGGFFIRLGIVYAGIKDQTPLHKYIEMQYFLRTTERGIGDIFSASFSDEDY